MPRFFVELFGWNARPEHFASAIVSAAVGIWLLLYRRRVRLNKLDYWILGYVAINYISSAFGSSEPSATLRWALQNNLAVLPYFLIRVLVPNLVVLKKAFAILLAVGIAESSYGIFCYLSHHTLGSKFGMELAYLGDVRAPYGSMYEPNLFGAYAGCCAAMFLALYIVGGQRNIGSLAGFLVASFAAALSFSRAALLALVIAVCFVFWRARYARNGGRRKVATLLLAVTLILIVAGPALGSVLQQRFSNLYYEGLTEGTAVTRFIEIREALQDIPQHPLLGSGTASFQLSFDWGKYVPDWGGKATWVGNVTVRVVHDTGFLGLATLLGFSISVWWKIRRCLYAENAEIAMLIGLTAGALLYSISFQATDGTILAFTWVHLGLLASAAVLMDDLRRDPNRTPGVLRSAG